MAQVVEEEDEVAEAVPSASKPGRIAELRRISGRPAPQSTAASSSPISSDPKTPSGQKRGPGPRQLALHVADLHDPPDQEVQELVPSAVSRSEWSQ